MLYQKCRPKDLKSIVGNKLIVESLQKVLGEKEEKRPHTFLFSGPTGCGKTTLARILAKEFGCESISLVEINAANTRGIDSIRELAESAETAPLFGKTKCFIIDESHQITPAAQEALLKVIEDCPVHAYFIFCTTDPDKLIKTIRNRCAKYQVVMLRQSEIMTVLTNAVKAEKLAVKDEVLTAIAKAANGCPREALTLLEQVHAIENAEEALEYLSSAETVKKEVIELCREVISNRTNRWENCVRMYPKLDSDPETIRLSLLGYIKKVLLGTSSFIEAARMVELISIFEKTTYGGGEATVLRMLFEACLVDEVK